MRLLVTGGAGFIGSHYVRTALTSGFQGLDDVEVVVLDSLTYAGNRANLDPVEEHQGFRFVRGDICDVTLVNTLMSETDQVVHFAAESHVDRSIRGAAEFVRTNVLGTQTLLDAALRHSVERFVHVSTDEVYGSIDVGSWDEESIVSPNSPYSASKAASDLMALAYFRTHGLPVVVTRCCNNYGPYQFPEKVIPLFVTNLLEGAQVPLYGDGGNVRDWLHVDDHCQAVDLVRAGGTPGEVYNIGGGTEVTNVELTRRLLDLLGADWSSVRQVPDRLGHDRRYSIDDTKIRRTLGYRPRVTFEQGLDETVAWYRDNTLWWGLLKERAALTPHAVEAVAV